MHTLARATTRVQAPNVQNIVQRMNSKLIAESKLSSAPSPLRAAQLRVRCNTDGSIFVHNVGIHAHDTDTDLNGQDNIRRSIEGHEAVGSTPRHPGILGSYGEGRPSGGGSVKFLIFKDAFNPPCCAGIGYGYTGASSDTGFFTKSASDVPGSGNYNRLYTTSAIVWKGDSSQIANYWYTHTTLHELSHVLGASQAPQGQALTNPFATFGGHCSDGNDALCYADGTPTQNGSAYSDTRCPNETPAGLPVDCAYDTYMNTEPVGGFLASFWNTGGAENPFYHFSTQ